MAKKETKQHQILWKTPHLNIPNVFKFDMSLNKAFNEYMTPLFKEKQEEFITAYMNRMLGKNEKTVVDNVSTPEGKFLAKISVGAFEIFNTYESMLDSEIYIRKFPYSKTRISKSRYLKNVIANHLNSVYMLKERMVKYSTLLHRTYGRRAPAYKELTSKITQILEEYIESSFHQLNLIRHSHVHFEEFYDSDIERLSILENFINNNPTIPSLDLLREYYDFEYDRIRKIKIKEIKKINVDTEDVLNNFFNLIYTIVFDEAGNFINITAPL